MKIKIEIDVPTACMIEAELKKILKTIRIDTGKATFLAKDITEFTMTTVDIIDNTNKPFMVGIDHAPEDSPEEGMNIQAIQYFSTEKEAQIVADKHNGADVYDLFIPLITVYGKENLK